MSPCNLLISTLWFFVFLCILYGPCRGQFGIRTSENVLYRVHGPHGGSTMPKMCTREDDMDLVLQACQNQGIGKMGFNSHSAQKTPAPDYQHAKLTSFNANSDGYKYKTTFSFWIWFSHAHKHFGVLETIRFACSLLKRLCTDIENVQSHTHLQTDLRSKTKNGELQFLDSRLVAVLRQRFVANHRCFLLDRIRSHATNGEELKIKASNPNLLLIRLGVHLVKVG